MPRSSRLPVEQVPVSTTQWRAATAGRRARAVWDRRWWLGGRISRRGRQPCHRARAGCTCVDQIGGFCHYEGPSACVSERREGERQSSAAAGHRTFGVRLELPPESKRPTLDCLPGSCALGGASALRLSGSSGSSALRPSGRRPGCGFASSRAIVPPSQAGVGFGPGSAISKPRFLLFNSESTQNELTAKDRTGVLGCVNGISRKPAHTAAELASRAEISPV